MKKLGDLMNQLGFRADAPDSVKSALLENLRRTLEEQNASRSGAPPAPVTVLETEAVATADRCPVVQTALHRESSVSIPEQLSLFETPSAPRKKPSPRAG